MSDSVAKSSSGLAPLPPRSRARRWLRRAEHCLAALAILAILWLVTPFQEWIYRSLDRQGELRHAEYLLCLGGSDSRLVESAKLMAEAWADRMIVMNHGPYSQYMKRVAIAWGVPEDRILLDEQSVTTRDHPRGAVLLGVDPEKDTCIIVTNYTHMARSQALFEHAGFKHLILREPRWERAPRMSENYRYGLRARIATLGDLLYEGGAWIKAKVAGDL
jgi:uncharacterized SAM-binding protein YcdF (DUF218 family)